MTMTRDEIANELEFARTHENFHSLWKAVNEIFKHLDGRGVLTGEPFLKGMRFQESAEEIKKENGQ
jgi:hypothetical protein